MLERLDLHNFKSWRCAEIDFGRITGFFGRNSSGKSSLIQFLLLLKQTKESTDRAATLDLNGPLVELGTVADVVHAHDEECAISFALNFKRDANLGIKDPSSPGSQKLVDSKHFGVRAKVGIAQSAFRCRSLAYVADKAEFSLSPHDKDPAKFELTASIPHSDFSFMRTRGRAWPLRHSAKAYRFPEQVRNYYQNAGFLADLEAAVEQGNSE